MILVADSSALIALSLCNALEFLDILFEEIKVPPAVFDEVTEVVTATLGGGLSVGVYDLCVSGTDAASNTGAAD